MAGKHLLEQGEKRRKEILLYLRSYIAKSGGWAPTIQEICDAVGLVSPNATRSHLRKLEEMGFIHMKPRVARAIALVNPQPDIKLLTTIKPTRKPRQPAAAPVEVSIVEREAPAKPARRRREKVPA